MNTDNYTRASARIPTEIEIGFWNGEPPSLKPVKVFDLSEGGAFLCLHPLPKFGEILSLKFDDRSEVQAKVVWCVDVEQADQLQRPPGVGVQFLNEDQPKNSQDATRTLVQEMVRKVEAGDIYGAFGLVPDNSDQDVKRRMLEVTKMMTENDLGRPTLKDAIRILKDPARRLEYDFKRGFHSRDSVAERPVALTGDEIRNAWRRAFPKRREMAKKFEKRAGELRVQGEFFAAIEKATAAHDMDPFNDRLRFAIQAWTRESEKQRMKQPRK